MAETKALVIEQRDHYAAALERIAEWVEVDAGARRSESARVCQGIAAKALLETPGLGS